MRLSVLDLVPVRTDQSTGDALAATVRLAQTADRLGFTRYWLAEHHNMPAVAATSPPVLIAYLAAQTTQLRLGSGGVMLPNHAPLAVAEQFALLEAAAPGRIDLGLGRAPGSDPVTARALRRNLDSDPDQFPQDVLELMDYFDADGRQPVRAVPGAGLRVPIWILGSSLFGAQLAAALGLPFAFASHFAPGQMLQALEVYRSGFRPSERQRRPHVMLGFNVFAADSGPEAECLATSMQQSFVSLLTGHPTRLPPPVPDYRSRIGAPERAMLDQVLSCSAIGAPATVAQGLRDFVARTGADELMINSPIFDHGARLRSYEITAGLMDPRP